MEPNVDAEIAILGAMFLGKPVARRMSAAIDPKWFWRESHRTIFLAAKELADAGRDLDLVSISNQLGNKLVDVGGEDYITQCVEFVPSAANADTYATIVREQWARREISKIGKQAGVPEHTLDSLISDLTNVARASASSMARSGNVHEFTKKRARHGVKTGYRLIDDATAGVGLRAGQMGVVSGYTGTGKSAWMLKAAWNATASGLRVGYITMADLNGEDILERLMRQLTGFGTRPVGPGAEEWDAAMDLVRCYDLFIHDTTEERFGYLLDPVLGWLDARQSSHNPFDLVFIDYAQKLRAKGRMSEYEHATECAAALRWSAARWKIPVWIGSQVTESTTGGKDVTKGSRVWEEDCAIHLSLKRVEKDSSTWKALPHEFQMDGVTVARLAKNRFGKSHLTDTYLLNQRAVFEEL
jgi:replicative DNA helicase